MIDYTKTLTPLEQVESLALADLIAEVRNGAECTASDLADRLIRADVASIFR